MTLPSYLRWEHVDWLDLRRFGKEFRGVDHQSSDYGTREMGFTAHFAGKCVENTKCRWPQTQREPNGSYRLLIRKL
jgi:hypothetical protein